MENLTNADKMLLNKVIGKYEQSLLRLLVLLEKYESETGYKKKQTIFKVEELYRKTFAADREDDRNEENTVSED